MKECLWLMYMDGQISFCSSVRYVKGQYYLTLNVVSGSLRSSVDVLICALKCVCVWMYRSVHSSVYVCVWM